MKINVLVDMKVWGRTNLQSQKVEITEEDLRIAVENKLKERYESRAISDVTIEIESVNP